MRGTPRGAAHHRVPLFSAGMFLRFGDFARHGLQAKTCFEAVISGERTSTTRFRGDSLTQYNNWLRARVGDVVEIWSGPYRSGWTGRPALIQITEAARMIDVSALTPNELQAWSLAEGWAPAKVSEWILTGHETRGIQVRYRLIG